MKELQTETVDGVAVVRPLTEIRVDNAEEVRRALHGMFDQGARKFLIDFYEVPFIDSSGIAVLFELLGKLRQEGGSMRFCRADRRIKGILEITRILTAVPLDDSQDSALAAF